MRELEVVDTWDKRAVSAHFSRDILDYALKKFGKSKITVFAGNLLYECLLAENESEKLLNGEVRFTRAPFLEDSTAVAVDLTHGKALRLEEYNL